MATQGRVPSALWLAAIAAALAVSALAGWYLLAGDSPPDAGPSAAAPAAGTVDAAQMEKLGIRLEAAQQVDNLPIGTVPGLIALFGAWKLGIHSYEQALILGLFLGMAGASFAVALPLGLIFLLVRFDPRVRVARQIAQKTSTPLLTVIPTYLTPKERRRQSLRFMASAAMVCGSACTCTGVLRVSVEPSPSWPARVGSILRRSR